MRTLLGLIATIGLLALLFLLFEQRDLDLPKSLAELDRSSLTVKLVLVAVVSVAILGLFREGVANALRSVLVWTAIALALAVGYTYRFEVREVSDRVLAEFVPGHAATRGRTVELARGGSGNFLVNAQINGARLRMILDTGATSVVLTQEAAKAAGLPLEVLVYSVLVETANGRTRAAPVTLQTVAVGGLIEREVAALVAQPGQLRQSLLGMSFLNRLQSWEVRGDRLVLRGYP